MLTMLLITTDHRCAHYLRRIVGYLSELGTTTRKDIDDLWRGKLADTLAASFTDQSIITYPVVTLGGYSGSASPNH